MDITTYLKWIVLFLACDGWIHETIPTINMDPWFPILYTNRDIRFVAHGVHVVEST